MQELETMREVGIPFKNLNKGGSWNRKKSGIPEEKGRGMIPARHGRGEQKKDRRRQEGLRV